MIEDPIVEEMRRHRQEHAARYGNELAAICEALREREAQSKRQIVNRGPRELLPTNRDRSR